jgi:hypothetical protein
MLRKVALAQGFRWAFPEDLSGLPYDAAELPDAESAPFYDKAYSTVPQMSSQSTQPAMSTANSDSHSIDLVPDSEIGPSDSPASEVEDEISKMNRLHDELRSILEDNEDAFTPKHQDWILAKARQASTADGVERMVAYARKVLKNAASMAATA